MNASKGLPPVITYPLEVDGVTTRVLQAGLAGPAIVLVHGLSSNADRWRHNLAPLAALGARVYAIDLPGHGFASKGGGFDYSAAGYSRFMAALLDRLDIDQVLLVGTSFGGLVTSAFAADHPERVGALAAMGAVGLVPMGEERRRRTLDWLPCMSREAIRERLHRSVTDATLITDAFVEADYRINNSPGAADAFAALAEYYATRIDDDATCERLAATRGAFPILLLWGEHDLSVARSYGEAAHQRLPGSHFELVPRTAHLPYFERPDHVNPLIGRFLLGAGI